MNILGMDWVTGMCFGIEFPPKEQDEEELETYGPMPWLVVHLGILRIFVTKYEVEE